MAVLFGLLVLAALVAIPVGLFRPKLILWKTSNPTRSQAMAVTVTCFAVLLGVWVKVLPEPEKSHAAREQAQQSAAPKGIGVSVAKLKAEFDNAGVQQNSNTDANGRPVINGKFPNAVTQIVGADEAIEASVSGFMGKDDAANIRASMLMATMIGTVFPGWQEWFAWFGQAVSKSGDQIVRDGRRVRVVVHPNVGMVQVLINPVQ